MQIGLSLRVHFQSDFSLEFDNLAFLLTLFREAGIQSNSNDSANSNLQARNKNCSTNEEFKRPSKKKKPVFVGITTFLVIAEYIGMLLTLKKCYYSVIKISVIYIEFDMTIKQLKVNLFDTN